MAPDDTTPPPDDRDATTLPVDPRRRDLPGRKVGPYRLLEALGAGGMGEVFLAEQREPVRRQVALKLIRPGMDSREVIARFESERQALAMMNHPHVARMLDAGTTDDGRPYFVMEHVPGEPITTYCDRHKLGLRERLELFVPVCQAIHHAHQKGIIHRDIKPSNVLVSVDDGRPVPKVIDFGVAKATQQRLTDKTLHTLQGHLVGTPAYMSPEQAEMTGLNVDTTSDVYSLGVLLYELLVGAPPFDDAELRAAGIAEIHRIIREVDPPRPSTRVGTLGARAADLAARRRAEPQRWRRLLHGELDWITMRAMEKDRTRRYPSASEFAADVERFLRGEPVAAGPPGWGYRLGKSVRRHRALVLGAAAVVVALGVGLAFAVGYAVQADRARRAAERSSYVANLGAAQGALASGEAGAAQHALAACPAAYRGWEWDYLRRRADQSVAVLARLDTAVTSLAWSGAGDYVAFGTREGEVRVVAPVPPYAVRLLARLDGPVTALATSGDGRLLVAAVGRDSTLHALDARDGRTIRRFHAAAAVSGGRPCFTAGDSVLVWGDAHGLTRFDARTGEVRARLLDDGSHRSPFAAGGGAFTDWQPLTGGERVAVIGPDFTGDVRIYDARTGALLRDTAGLARRFFGIPVAAGGGVVAYAAYGAPGADGTGDPETRLVVTVEADGDGVHRVPMTDRFVGSLAVAADGREFAAGQDDGVIRVWRTRSGRFVDALAGHTAAVTALAYDPAGDWLASSSRDGTVRLWDLRELDRRRGAEPSAFAADLLADPATGELDVAFPGAIATWDLAGGGRTRILARTPAHELILPYGWATHAGVLYGCRGVRFDTEFSVIVGEPTGLRTTRIERGAVVDCYVSSPPDSAIVGAYCVAPARAWFALSRTEDRLRDAPARVREILRPRPLRPWRGHNLQVLDFNTGAVLAEIDEDGPAVTTLAPVDDGRRLAVGCADGTCYLVGIADGRRTPLTRVLQGAVNAFACAPGGTRVAAASEDRTVAVWDVATGALAARLVGHERAVGDVGFGREGRRLFTTAEDRTLRVWGMPDGQLLLTIRDDRLYELRPRLAVCGDAVAALVGGGAIVFTPDRPFPRLLRRLASAEGR